MSTPDRETLLTAMRHAAEGLTGTGSVRDLKSVLTMLVHSAVDTVPGAVGGGISRTEQGTVRSSHATSDEVYQLDQLQSRLGQGPCITAADDPPEAGIVLADDLAGADASRWPGFAPAAVTMGYCCLLSIPLSLTGDRRSALNLYARERHAYDESAQLTAGLFGLQAAVLLHGADHAAHLGHALATRDVIGQAKGILMERFTVDDNEAFQMLVKSSQDVNLKLVDIARWLTAEARARRERRPRIRPDPASPRPGGAAPE